MSCGEEEGHHARASTGFSWFLIIEVRFTNRLKNGLFLAQDGTLWLFWQYFFLKPVCTLGVCILIMREEIGKTEPARGGKISSTQTESPHAMTERGHDNKMCNFLCVCLFKVLQFTQDFSCPISPLTPFSHALWLVPYLSFWVLYHQNMSRIEPILITTTTTSWTQLGFCWEG